MSDSPPPGIEEEEAHASGSKALDHGAAAAVPLDRPPDVGARAADPAALQYGPPPGYADYYSYYQYPGYGAPSYGPPPGYEGYAGTYDSSYYAGYGEAAHHGPYPAAPTAGEVAAADKGTEAKQQSGPKVEAGLDAVPASAIPPAVIAPAGKPEAAPAAEEQRPPLNELQLKLQQILREKEEELRAKAQVNAAPAAAAPKPAAPSVIKPKVGLLKGAKIVINPVAAAAAAAKQSIKTAARAPAVKQPLQRGRPSAEASVSRSRSRSRSSSTGRSRSPGNRRLSPSPPRRRPSYSHSPGSKSGFRPDRLNPGLRGRSRSPGRRSPDYRVGRGPARSTSGSPSAGAVAQPQPRPRGRGIPRFSPGRSRSRSPSRSRSRSRSFSPRGRGWHGGSRSPPPSGDYYNSPPPGWREPGPRGGRFGPPAGGRGAYGRFRDGYSPPPRGYRDFSPGLRGRRSPIDDRYRPPSPIGSGGDRYGPPSPGRYTPSPQRYTPPQPRRHSPRRVADRSASPIPVRHGGRPAATPSTAVAELQQPSRGGAERVAPAVAQQPVEAVKAAAAVAAAADFEDEFADLDRIDIAVVARPGAAAAGSRPPAVAPAAAQPALAAANGPSSSKPEQAKQQHIEQPQQQSLVKEIDLQLVDPDSYYAAKAQKQPGATAAPPAAPPAAPQRAAGKEQLKQRQLSPQQQEPSDQRHGQHEGPEQQQLHSQQRERDQAGDQQAGHASDAVDADEGLEIAAGKGLGRRSPSPGASASEGELDTKRHKKHKKHKRHKKHKKHKHRDGSPASPSAQDYEQQPQAAAAAGPGSRRSQRNYRRGGEEYSDEGERDPYVREFDRSYDRDYDREYDRGGDRGYDAAYDYPMRGRSPLPARSRSFSRGPSPPPPPPPVAAAAGGGPAAGASGAPRVRGRGAPKFGVDGGDGEYLPPPPPPAGGGFWRRSPSRSPPPGWRGPPSSSYRSRSRSHSYEPPGGYYRSRSPPRPDSSGRSRSPGFRGYPQHRKRPRSYSRSYSRSRSRSRRRYRSRSRSRDRGPAAPQRSKEEIAAELARVSEITRLQSLQQAQLTPQALQLTRHARRVYVGNLPPTISEVGLTHFFNQVMMAVGAGSALGSPVIGCYMNPDKRFAFVEFRNVEEASNAMAFDGVACQGEMLRIRRPHDYNPTAAKALGPSEPSPHMNLALLSVVGGLVDDAAAPRISVMGLPTALEEDQVRSIISSFGVLKAFSLLRDASGQPMGTALAEFTDPGVINPAIAGLSVMVIGGQQLRAARAGNTENAIALQQLITQQQAALMQRLTGKPVTAVMAPALTAAPAAAPTAATEASPAKQNAPASAAAPAPAPAADDEDGQASELTGAASAPLVNAALVRVSSVVTGRVVRLACMVERDELLDDEDYEDIVEDTRTEVAKYGALKQVVIPRPASEDPSADPPGVGLVFLEYEDVKSAEKARLALNGRMFGDKPVQASIFDQAKFDERQYE